MANDPPILADTNLYTSDSTLRAAVTRYGGEWAAPEIIAYGEKIGSSEAIEWGYEANRDVPRLATHDRFGNRSDTVTFHPAWHHLMRQAVSAGLHALPWSEPRMGAHVARAACRRAERRMLTLLPDLDDVLRAPRTGPRTRSGGGVATSGHLACV